MTPGFLLHKSALARWSTPQVAAVLDPLLLTRQLFTCPVIELEVRYSARSPADYAALVRDREQAYRWVDTDAQALSLALQWQARLAAASQLRAVGIPDLMIAATASVRGLVVLHYDSDFEILSTTCPVAQQFVVPRGSVR